MFFQVVEGPCCLPPKNESAGAQERTAFLMDATRLFRAPKACPLPLTKAQQKMRAVTSHHLPSPHGTEAPGSWHMTDRQVYEYRQYAENERKGNVHVMAPGEHPYTPTTWKETAHANSGELHPGKTTEEKQTWGIFLHAISIERKLLVRQKLFKVNLTSPPSLEGHFVLSMQQDKGR